MKNGTNVRALEDGKLELSIFRAGQKVGRTAFEARVAGLLALQALAAASAIHQQSGKPLGPPDDDLHYIVPTSVGLAPSAEKDHECLCFRFGEATLAISLPRDDLRHLGQALIALINEGQAH